MRTLSFLAILFMFLTFSCKSDKSMNNSDGISEGEETEINMDDMNLEADQEVDLEMKMDEAIPEDKLAQKLIVDSKKTKVSEIAKVEDKNETKLVGKTADQVKKEEQLKEDATKKMIAKSVNKGKTCTQILKEQEDFVASFAKSKDRKVILAMAKAKNDPFFAQCLKDADFEKKIEALNTKLEEIMDQE